MDASLPLLSFVIPMWNEEDYIGPVTEAVREVGERMVGAGEIRAFQLVLVNDASTDRTPVLADELAATHDWITVVHHPQNRGLGGAVRSGLAAADGDFVCYTDADLPCDMAEVERALRLARRYRADIVSAWRKDRTAEGPRRAIYSFIYNRLVALGFGLRLRDVNFAFKLISKAVLDDVSLSSEGSFIDAELLIRAHRKGYRIVQFGVDFFPRTRGVSTLSSGSTIVKILREMGELRSSLGERPAETHASQPGKLLVVNADDYGLTTKVSEGILRGHRDGIITSTSVLVLAPAFATTGPWLRDVESIGVGAHLALVGEDRPLLSATEIPTLVDRDGRLAPDWRSFLWRARGGRIDIEDIRRELGAQLEAVQQLGLRLDHLDTHQHLHLWPDVRDVVIDLAQRAEVPVVRVPRSAGRTPVGMGVNLLSRRLESTLHRCGLHTSEASAGLDEAGALDAVRLGLTLDRLARSDARTLELFTHPGEADDRDRDRYRWGYRWEQELEALTGPAAKEAVACRGLTLVTYDALAR
jgi:predicted glycoside hydrolase/deacetylase ChbG (UPF0249 family)